MTDKATIERLVELTRATQGKSTKRPPAEVLKSEISTGLKYTSTAPITTTSGVIEVMSTTTTPGTTSIEPQESTEDETAEA